MNLSDKIIVITGGSGLLGSEFCRAVVKNEGQVIIADNNKDSADKLAIELNSLFGKKCAYSIYLDITNPSSISGLLKELGKKFGKIDALVNNAYPRNKNYGRKFFDVNFEDFCENLNLHLGGYFLASQYFSNYFIKQGYGNIINISSIFGVIPPRFETYVGTEMTMPVEYAVIKSGIIHLTKYLSKLLKGKNIRVNAISPGGIKHEQSLSFIKNYGNNCLNKGMLDPVDVSGTLVFLLSDDSLNINGQNIIVDDGFTL